MRKRIRQAGFLQGIGPLRAWTVYFDSDSTSPTGTRGHLARGKVANVATGSQTVQNDFDAVPIFQRPIFNATWDENTRCFVDFIARGEEGFTFSPRETGREVVYRCTPFWYRLELNEAGALQMVSVSDEPLDGYTLAPMFRDGKTPVYRPCFEAAVDYGVDRKLHSRAGLAPYVTDPHSLQGVVEARSASARLESTAEWFSDYLLLLVEFATRNLQGVLHGLSADAIPLFNASNIRPDYQKGLYCSEDPGLSAGDEVNLLADSGMGELSSYGTFTVERVTYVEGAGFWIQLRFLDVESLFWETYDWAIIRNAAKTGVALSAVTNASSGRAFSSAYAPIVWRGKENPWGNTQSLLCNEAVQVQEDGRMRFCRLEQGKTPFAFSTEGTYRPCGEWMKGISGESTYIKGMALCDEGDMLHPILFEDYAPDRYYAARATCLHGFVDPEGAWLVIAVGGNCLKRLGTNHATMELIGQLAPDSRWSMMGGRLIFEEA